MTVAVTGRGLLDRARLRLAAEIGHRLGQVSNGDGCDSRQDGLCGRLVGAEGL